MAANYWLTLLWTPTFQDSFAIATSDTPIVYKSWKRSLRMLGLGTELYRSLQSDDNVLGAFRVERMTRASKQLAAERNALYKQAAASQDEAYLQSLASAFAAQKGVMDQSPPFFTLLTCLSMLQSLNAFRQSVIDRTETVYLAERDEPQLRRLWSALKPRQELKAVVDKRWQEVGFQGTSPWTDLRATGMLGLDHLLYLVDADPERARTLVEEAVEGGKGWYPLAIVSIAMTDFLVNCLKDGTLTLLLLSKSSGLEQDTLRAKFDRLHSRLLYAFHDHWLYLQVSDMVADEDRPTVMQFEQVFKRWRTESVRWLCRGRSCTGWFDARGFICLDELDASDRKMRPDEAPLIDL